MFRLPTVCPSCGAPTTNDTALQPAGEFGGELDNIHDTDMSTVLFSEVDVILPADGDSAEVSGADSAAPAGGKGKGKASVGVVVRCSSAGFSCPAQAAERLR